MLKINNLHASVEGKEILRGINLEVNAGEVHAIMGPNGSGKSTLAAVIAGKEEFEVTKGNVVLNGEDLEDDAPELPVSASPFRPQPVNAISAIPANEINCLYIVSIVAN